MCGCHDCDDVTVPETLCFQPELEEEKKSQKKGGKKVYRNHFEGGTKFGVLK